MTRVKTIRLKKLATEANISVERIIEFLHEQGIEDDFNPNTKVLPEWHELIMEEFSSDKDLKDKSSKVSHVRKERKSLAIDHPAEEPSETPEEEPIAKVEPEIEPKPVDQDQKIKKEKVGPTVVGKIDLEKSKPKKKQKPEEKIIEEATKEEIEDVKSEKPDLPVKKEKSAVEEPKAEEPKAEPIAKDVKKTAESETIKAKAKILKAPTVIGKIELPKKPKPAASSSDKKSNSVKQKRKRITTKAVDVNKVAKTGGPGQRKQKRKAVTRKPELTEEEIQKEIKETLARLSTSKK